MFGALLLGHPPHLYFVSCFNRVQSLLRKKKKLVDIVIITLYQTILVHIADMNAVLHLTSYKLLKVLHIIFFFFF